MGEIIDSNSLFGGIIRTEKERISYRSSKLLDIISNARWIEIISQQENHQLHSIGFFLYYKKDEYHKKIVEKDFNKLYYILIDKKTEIETDWS